MKYIRTKDGIIDLSKIAIRRTNGWKSIEDYIFFKEEEQRFEQIRQANTIEELCDDFVIEYDDNSCEVFDRVPEPYHLYRYENLKFEKDILRPKIFFERLKREIGTKEEVNALDDHQQPLKFYNIEWIKNIYGAIWTDKGLIYVAKMNEKRELELL